MRIEDETSFFAPPTSLGLPAKVRETFLRPANRKSRDNELHRSSHETLESERRTRLSFSIFSAQKSKSLIAELDDAIIIFGPVIDSV